MGSIGSRIRGLEVDHTLRNDDARWASGADRRIGDDSSKGRSTERGSARNHLNRSISELHFPRPTEEARRSVAEEEGPGLQSRWLVEQHVVPNGVLVINSGSGSDHGLSGLEWIPGNSDLRSEVSVGLTDLVAETRQE